MTITNKNEFIGNRIKEYRNKKKWFQQELADRVGMTKGAISTYEKGRVAAPIAKLQAIANVLEVTLNDLLPIEEHEQVDSIDEHIKEAKAKLSSDQLAFLELLIAKTYTLPLEERNNFLKNVKFAVQFFDEN